MFHPKEIYRLQKESPRHRIICVSQFFFLPFEHFCKAFVRFRDAATGEMVERSWSMPYEERAPAFAKATPSLRLAGVAALLAEKLLETPVADQFKLGDLAEPVNALRREYAAQPRVQELVTMFTQMRQLTRE